MTEHSSSESPTILFRTTIAAAVALLGFTLVFIESFKFGQDAAFFPRIIAVAGGLSSAYVLVNSLLKVLTARRAGEWTAGGEALNWTDLTISYVSPVIYAALLYLLGFWIASTVCLMGLMALMGERKWWLMTVITAGTVLTIYAVFYLGFNIRMPAGVLIGMMDG
jgi:hypothetical protein